MRRAGRVLTPCACGIALVAGMTACGGGKTGGTKTYRVGVDIPFHPLVDYVIAKQDKYFSGKPYRVRFRVLDPATLVPAFGKGDLDVAATFPSFLPRIEQSYGVVTKEFFPLGRIVGGPAASALWVPKASPVRNMQDLKGARVASQPLGQVFGIEEAMVEAATGQSIRKYFHLQESAAPSQQLILGRVSAAFVNPPEVIALVKTGKFRQVTTVQEIFKRRFGDPLVLSGGLTATTGFIARNRPFVNDLDAALQDAWDVYVKNPKAVIAVAAKQSGVSPQQLGGFGMAVGLPVVPRARRVVTERDVKTWTGIYPLLARSGFLKRAPGAAAKYFLVTK